MSKAYWNGPRPGDGADADRRSGNPYLSGSYRSDYGSASGHSRFGGETDDSYGSYGATATDVFHGTETYGDYDADFDDYDDYDDDGYRWWYDPRWRILAAVAGVILLIVVITIAFAMRGDSTETTPTGSTTQPSSPVQDAISTTPRTVIATVPPAPPAAPAPSLAPETVVTITNPPQVASTPAPPPPLPEGVAPGPSITYTVTGSRQLFDLVTIIYSDEQGFPRTDINVALPWTRTVVLNPGVQTKSVTATSLTGQLNCTITDGTGATIAASNTNAPMTTCNG